MKNYEERLKNGETLTDRELSIYYNHKYPRENVRYWGRGLPGKPNRIECDVSNFVTPDDNMVKDVIKELGIKIGSDDHDTKAELIQKWVVDNMRYVYDETQHGFTEFWQFTYETLQLGAGDCEDGAVLMASLLIAAGVPRWRVRVAGGLVKTGQPTAPTGGHGWCCYLRQSDQKWIVLDWCYLPDMAPIAEKMVFKDNKNYIETWFSWNDKWTWGKQAFNFVDIKQIAKDVNNG
jgi:hypothetical protein